MKRNVRQILLTLALVLLLPSALLLVGASLPSCYSDSYYAELSPMVQRLWETEGKKLIVLGNSDVAFGLDGALMEQLLAEQGYDYTVCPFGLYAAVGTSAMLELSKNTLHRGDLVILVIEPVSETLSSYFGASAFWRCSEDASELLLRTNSSQRAALLGNYLGFLQERYAYFRDKSQPVVQGVYARASFNERCDMLYERAGNIMTIGYDISEPIELSSVSVEPAFAEQVADYCSTAEKNGASVCVSFSPMNRSAMQDASLEAVSAYFDRINAAFPCPLISDPSLYILDSGWFYDSNFHLNSAGAEVRTVLLTEDILAYLGCYRSVEHELPTVPDPTVKPTESAGDTAAFTYAPVGEGAGWLISGLTETGREQLSLTVPSIYQGAPVVGFASDALTAAAVLEELTVPASVDTLPDHLFNSCRKLSRLILQHTNTPCGITEHSLDGADQLRIFVPSSAFPLYRDGYGCETNPWSKYLDIIYLF